MDGGTIVSMEVYNPPGSHRVCRCRILEELSVLWPGNAKGYIATDGTPVIWTEYYTLKSPKYRLLLKAWNVSEDWPHDVIVRINVLPTVVAAGYLILRDLASSLKRMLGMK